MHAGHTESPGLWRTTQLRSRRTGCEYAWAMPFVDRLRLPALVAATVLMSRVQQRHAQGPARRARPHNRLSP